MKDMVSGSRKERTKEERARKSLKMKARSKKMKNNEAKKMAKDKKKMKTKEAEKMTKDKKKMKTKEEMKTKEAEKMTKDKKKMKTKEEPCIPGTTLLKGYVGRFFSGKHYTRITEDPSGNKRKEVVVRLAKGYLEYMLNHPKPPPTPLEPTLDPLGMLIEREVYASELAKYEAGQKAIKQYKEFGYGEMVLEVLPNDDDDE